MDFFDELLKTEREPSKAPGMVSGIVLENYNDKYPGMVKVEYGAGEKGKGKKQKRLDSCGIFLCGERAWSLLPSRNRVKSAGGVYIRQLGQACCHWFLME